MKSSLVAPSKLGQEPYSLILGYPRATKEELKKRVAELKKLGVTTLSFEGQTILNNIPVLGKGYVGVVVLSRIGKRIVALKIRRMDSSRMEMRNEAKLLKIANKVNVGPKLINSSKNFIIMEYLEGRKIIDWVKELKGRGSAAKLRHVLRAVLEDCYNLDCIGLDHGELSYIHKHVIIGRSPCIIDFESASTNRRTCNVTSATQSIFIGSGLARIVNKIIKTSDRSKLIASLKKYKHDQTRENFDEVLDMLRLNKN